MLSYSLTKFEKHGSKARFLSSNSYSWSCFVSTPLFSIPDILACRFERESLFVVAMSPRMERLLSGFLSINPQGATILDLVQAQELPKLESALTDFSQTATCQLNSSEPTTVLFRCHPDPLSEKHALLVGEAIEDLEAQVQLLEKKLSLAQRDRERLVSLNGLLVHDLRNTLQVFLSHTDLAVRSLDRNQSEDLRRRLEILSSSGRDMTRRLEAIGKYLRLEIGDYPREMTDLNELILGCSNRAQKYCSRPLNIVHLNRFPTLVCERQLVDELFSNLIGNAIRYSQNDPVEIEIGLAQPEAVQPVFFVRDSGIGIHPEDLPHVFTPLKRSDRGRLNAEGSGMGLAYVKQIVERHQGNIWLESAVNNGTTVNFSLGPLPGR